MTVSVPPGLLMLPLIATVCLLPVLCHGLAEGRTFWVASYNQDQCTEDMDPCELLEDYQAKGGAIFSTSHSTWIFLKGKHMLLQQSVVVSAAENITWRGNGSVSEVVIELPACYLRNKKSDNELDSAKYELYASIMTEDVKNFTLENISLTSYHACVMNTLPPRYALILTDTTDISLRNVYVEFDHHSMLYGIQVLNPSEEFTLEDGEINAHIDITLKPRASSYSLGSRKRLQLGIHRLYSLFSTGITFDIADYASTTYTSASVVFSDCTFISGEPDSQIGVTLQDYPTNWFSLEVISCIFNGNEGRDSLIRAIPINMTFHLVQRFTEFGVVRVEPHVCITNSIFTNNHGGVVFSWQMEHETTSELNSSRFVVPAVTITNCQFSENEYEGAQLDCVVCAFFKAQQFNANYNSSGGPVAFTMHNCSVHQSKIGKPLPFVGGVITIQGFMHFRACLAGDNIISNNQGRAMLVAGSKLEFHGYNEISRSEALWEGGGMYMSADSQLLLVSNAYLKLYENKAVHYGGGIYVSHNSLESSMENEDLSYFVACYVNKTMCPGLCFFQFIGTDGLPIQSKEELPSINATIDVSNNIGLEGGNNIFNGHIEGCLLQMQNGLETINHTTLRKIFTIDVGKEDVPMSFPYKVCLCRPMPSDSPVDVYCAQNLKVKTYAFEKLEVMLSILGDMSQRMPAITHAELHSRLFPLTMTRVEKVYSCEGAFTVRFPALGGSYTVNLRAGLPETASILAARLPKTLTIEIDNSTCPPGMTMKDVQVDSRRTVPLCQCSPHLTMHGISCTVYLIDTTYKAAGDNYWLGMKAGQLVFSAYCPYFFCNDFFVHNELALQDINKTQQCVNGRQGLMCSECPEGTSAVLGSINCKICSNWWLLLVFGFFVSGIIVVTVLLVLNLTILQGSITGAIFYLNTTYIFNDFLHHYATGIIYFLLSTLNFQIGFEVCFFDGMDEFWKALLQFAFPFYLFTLLIVIIIITQKCGYRMFKAHFIARRAVPVLATIMLLTYTDLVTVVTVALQPNTLYDAKTGYSEKVWLYQPSLPYFSERHLVLGIMSVAVAVFYLVPFTAVMLFGDVMRRFFHKLWFSHFMDVLHGAFTWPLGFWIGFRLLIRILFVAMSGFLTSPNMPCATLWGTGVVLVLQLLIRPFKKWKEGSHSSQYPFHTSTVQHHTINITGRAARLKQCVRRILEPEVFDALFLLNTMLASSAALYSSSPRASKRLTSAMVNISILLALIELLAIVVIHVYKFFPLSETARNWLEMCWGRIKMTFRQKRETEIVENVPDEYPLNDPIAVGIYELRPPEQDEESEDESTYSHSSFSCQREQTGYDCAGREPQGQHITSQLLFQRHTFAQTSSTTCKNAQGTAPLQESRRAAHPPEQDQQLREPLLMNTVGETAL